MSPYRNAVLVTVLLIVSAAGGFFAYRWLVIDEPTEPWAAAALPTRRPSFELPDVSGQLRSSEEWAGQALVVNFWATWCKPCRTEIPLLMELHERYARLGVQLVGVALDDREAVADYAEELGIDYPLLVGEQATVDLAYAFGIEFPALPFTVFTAADGAILGRKLGELDRSEAERWFETLGRSAGEGLSPAEAGGSIAPDPRGR